LTFTISILGKPDEQRIIDQSIIKIGRMPSAHLQIEDEEVARIHAVIEVADDGAITIIDLGSTNGTFVNDERTNKKVLAPGDRIRIGPATIILESAPPKPLVLPSPEVVRERVGSSFSPTNVFGIAAIVLRVDGVRRHAWSDETELAERLFHSYPRGAIPAPELVPESRNFKTIDDAEATHARRCSKCIIRPGYEPCPMCNGTGAGSGSDPGAKCYACSGAAFIPCTDCDGTTRVVACAVRYVNDHFVRVRRVLVPQVSTSIRSFVEARISADAPWSKDHAFDPEPGMVASAYRGASAMRSAEDFHGFFFGDALTRCLDARAEATTGLARFETSAFAIPILWAVTGEPTRGERHDAYFFDATGSLQHVH
jgi:predicted component of type VI protein secretion system